MNEYITQSPITQKRYDLVLSKKPQQSWEVITQSQPTHKKDIADLVLSKNLNNHKKFLFITKDGIHKLYNQRNKNTYYK